MNSINKGFMIICKHCKNHIDIYSGNDLEKVMNKDWSIEIETTNEWTLEKSNVRNVEMNLQK